MRTSASRVSTAHRFVRLLPIVGSISSQSSTSLFNGLSLNHLSAISMDHSTAWFLPRACDNCGAQFQTAQLQAINTPFAQPKDQQRSSGHRVNARGSQSQKASHQRTKQDSSPARRSPSTPMAPRGRYRNSRQNGQSSGGDAAQPVTANAGAAQSHNPMPSRA